MRVGVFALAMLCSTALLAGKAETADTNSPIYKKSNIVQWLVASYVPEKLGDVKVEFELVAEPITLSPALTIPHHTQTVASIPAQPNQVNPQIKINPDNLKPNKLNQSPSVVAIIIDDIGDKYKAGMRIIDLEGDITISILPYTPFSKKLAEHALLQNKEVMLHQPMQAIEHKFQHKGTLFTTMSRSEFEKTLDESIKSIPHVQGINNHMGSLLTQDDERMNWLMEYLAKRDDLYFIDSRTTAQSVAVSNAEKFFVRNASRDVFLDHSRSVEDIEKQWKYFIKLASQRGSAVLIAHPYPETIEFLEKHLADLETHNLILVPMSELIQLRDTQRIVRAK